MAIRTYGMACRSGLLLIMTAALVGCRTAGAKRLADAQPLAYEGLASSHSADADSLLAVYLASTEDETIRPAAAESVYQPSTESELQMLIAEALANNPQLRRLLAETRAAWERVPQVRALADPMAEGTVFGEPQMMADGEMRGTFMISQTLPYLKQLDARGQQTAFEALIAQQEVQAARLRLAADVEEAWHRLYLLGQLLRINDANRQLIESLVEVATGRVEVGETTPGDVILGTLELGRVKEDRLMLRQQVAARRALLNQALNRPADSPLELPDSLAEAQLTLTLDEARSLALANQPEIIAARLRTQAAAWGIRIARLERLPELTLSYEQMFMRMNAGEHGADPWRVGLGMNVPLWRTKYAAMEREARHQNFAAHQGVEEAIREYDAVLLDLVEQARAADDTARLYRTSILPQSRQAFEADQRAYAQGTVTFERVINDAQNLLTAESALHRALAEKAIALARLKQAAGGVLPFYTEELPSPLPPATPLPD